ncbi:MAG: 16S rRNA (uracil(1498)-N(3))-methyltransferase [Lachnospiraceae bacterium]|nr:16S rRNA (uracil(1498)-N(3))-methyltransferase [Lachnospiraceae bacterium]
MYHFFIEPEQVQGREIAVIGPDVNHIRSVLRMKPGEEISVSDGRGKTYACVIEALEPEKIRLGIQKIQEISTELGAQVTLYQGLPKGDKLELIIQKCVELGVSRIVPVTTRRTIVKLDAKKEASRVQRWNGIAHSAAKQSGRSLIPQVTGVYTLAEAVREASQLDVCLIPYELAEDMEKTRQELGAVRPGQSVGIFIGPEGGFDEAEVEQVMKAGGRPITLGRRILRTETAGMAVLAMLTLLLEE